MNPTSLVGVFMNRENLLKLNLLGAIWGGSFIFIHILVPHLGAIGTAFFRVFVAGSILCGFLYLRGVRFEWKQNWKHYLWIGLLNSALPFTLFSYSALTLPASLLAILNASSPLFGVLLSALFLGDALNARKVMGLFMGILGVGLVSIDGALRLSEGVLPAIGCALAASACYAVAGIYIKKRAHHIQPKTIAGTSLMGASLFLAPMLLFFPVSGLFSFEVGAALLGLAVLCTSIALMIYFQLVKDVGPSRALTVTFLIPAFGVLWGYIFLGEAITPKTLLGCLAIVIGTALVIRQPRLKTAKFTKLAVQEF